MLNGKKINNLDNTNSQCTLKLRNLLLLYDAQIRRENLVLELSSIKMDLFLGNQNTSRLLVGYITHAGSQVSALIE